MRAQPWIPGLAFLVALEACAGGGGGTVPAGVEPGLSEDAWEALATPRAEPLPGAARVSVGDVGLLGVQGWGGLSASELDRVVDELVVAGLLRRRDVQLVERRRFAAAAERERRGLPRPAGAPPVGVSAGAEYIATGTWSTAGFEQGWVDVRLADAATGDVVGSWRTATGREADPVAVARTVVGGVLTVLSGLDRRPAWTDPVPDAAPAGYRATAVSPEALALFASGLRSEDAWEWNGARLGYQGALVREDDFFEAGTALARVARLRAGGTLGVNP